MCLFDSSKFVILRNLPFPQAIKETGMGPKGAPMLSGYTHYHQNLESALARLKSKEVYHWPFLFLYLMFLGYLIEPRISKRNYSL